MDKLRMNAVKAKQTEVATAGPKAQCRELRRGRENGDRRLKFGRRETTRAGGDGRRLVRIGSKSLPANLRSAKMEPRARENR
ncbi:hypothetical protein NL676_012300 [Syzygium grande]|nr:hypothetical protein NL676_012300 [Syzygium grande]